MAKSVLEQIRALDDQKNKLMTEAKSEALAKVQAAVAELNELGFNYRVSEGGGGYGGNGRKGTRQINASKPCSVCKFQTTPPHDARAHRSQDPKKAFTAAELNERGMTKA